MLVDVDKEKKLESTPEEITEEPSTLKLQTLSLNLPSFNYWEFTPHHTFKAKGTIQGSEVIVLVDSGAEANFLSTPIVSSLGLSVSQMRPFQVEVGNGAINTGVEGCEIVKLIVQSVSIVANFLVVELGRSEVVFGARWVASLGRFEGDYQQLTLSWMSNGSRVTLQEDPSHSRSHASGKMALIILKNNEESFLETPLFCYDGDNITSPITIETLELLQQFDDIFQEPDGGWQFWVDYRALNKITVLDKFPIPIIEEFLDELAGAMVFSKLDLKFGYHQIRMKETDIHKMTFQTHEGHDEFLVMPFGLTNAPSILQ